MIKQSKSVRDIKPSMMPQNKRYVYCMVPGNECHTKKLKIPDKSGKGSSFQ